MKDIDELSDDELRLAKLVAQTDESWGRPVVTADIVISGTNDGQVQGRELEDISEEGADAPSARQARDLLWEFGEDEVLDAANERHL